MPAPRPSITAITVANDGRASGLGQRGQQDLPDDHADQRAGERDGHRRQRAEQQRQQHDRDRHADQLADRRGLLGGEVDEDCRARTTLTPSALAGLGGLHERLAVRLLEVLRLGRSSGPRPTPAARRATASRPWRTGPRRPGRPSRSRTLSSAPVTAARGAGSEILPCLTVKTSVESAPAKAGLCFLKRSSACWDSVPGMLKSSAALPPAPAAMPSSTTTAIGAGEAALPMVGQGAGEPREQQGHRHLPARIDERRGSLAEPCNHASLQRRQ